MQGLPAGLALLTRPGFHVSTVLVISFSDLASDPRVDRQIRALRARHDVVAAGLGAPAYDDVAFVDINTSPRTLAGRFRGVARRLTRDYEAVYWEHPANQAVLTRLHRVTADAVIVNDARALPIAAALGPPVVFDAHEYAPDELGDKLWWRLVTQPLVRWQCERYIPQVAAMTTVSDGIAEAYERLVGVRATVVMNTPPFADLSPTTIHDPVRILHHGAALRGRGLEEMLRLADLLDERFTVDFVLVESSPGYRDALEARAKHNPRVRFPPPVPMRELVTMANGYDIGLYLLQPSNLNQRHALPNKFFEFVQGRLALAIGPSPEMARLVRRYGCGVVAGDFTPEALAAEINRLDAAQIAAFKQGSHAAAAELSAEPQTATVLRLVERALDRSAPIDQPGER
jgi:glycosyl transferase family 4